MRNLVPLAIIIALIITVNCTLSAFTFEDKNDYYILSDVEYLDEIVTECKKYQNDIDLITLLTIISCESDFYKDAVSSIGAVGLMQISPIGLREYNRLTGENIKTKDLYDIKTNIKVGVKLYTFNYRYTKNELELYLIYNVGINNYLSHKDSLVDGYMPNQGKYNALNRYQTISNYYKKIL